MTLPFLSPRSLRPLRPHQEQALEALRLSLASGRRRPMLQAPTGFGKTLLAAHIIKRALDKGKRVALTVPALSLIDQTVAALEAEGIAAIGVMQGIHERTDHSQPVQVCSIQTIARRKRPEVDLVLVDEAHQLHKEVFRWIADAPAIPFLGLSATPWARGLGKFYDDLIVAATPADLIERGYLSPFVVYAPSELDLQGIRTVAGDYHQGELSERVNTAQLVGDVIQTWQTRGADRLTLCYGVDRAHAQHLKQRFGEAGIAAAYIDAFTGRQERERIFDRFRAGELRVICNVATLTTGLDLPMISCIIDARPTKSEMLFVQTIGRGLRTHPGKTNCLVLDHAGNALRLGLVTDIRHDTLDDGELRKKGESDKPERTGSLPRVCEQCKAVLPRGTRTCPHCGYEPEATSPVRVVDGELVRLGSGERSNVAPSFADKVKFFAELRGYGAIKGYTAGWAKHKFKEKFHHWPDGLDDVAFPEPPSLRVKNWIRSRQIAFAKARERANG